MLARSLVALFVCASAAPAFAQDAFEVQVYDSETAPQGSMGLEAHLNYFSNDSREGHLTLEPHIGLGRWLEAGMYFTSAFSARGYDFAGVKVRLKARWPEKLAGVIGLSLNTELSFGGGTYDDSGYGWELRPIIDADFKRFYVSFNPIIDVSLTGPGAGASFEPALKGAVKVFDFLAVGAEYYMNLGTFARFAPLAEQTHRIFGAIDANTKVGKAELGLNLGVGYTLVGQDQLIVKAIVSVDFD